MSAASGPRCCLCATHPDPVGQTTCSPAWWCCSCGSTVLFGNFADAMAEGRGKAHADALRRARQETVAHILQPDGTVVDTPSQELKVDDRCVIEAGQAIPGDGEVVEGMAMVDESAITGESAPVVRESGGDLSAVTGGTVVLSDRIVVSITSPPGQPFWIA
jgi:K+-transporting ATPase ATPase B chain